MKTTRINWPARDEMIEIGSAVVLSVAGLMTTWSGYQSALWDGDQAAHYAEANALHAAAVRAADEANSREAVAVQMFSAWVDAASEEKGSLADFYRARFPVEFRPSFEKWLSLQPFRNPDAPSGPFAMPGYEPAGRAKERRLEHAADAAFARGQRANEISDSFVRASVTLGTAMFFAGIGQVFRIAQVRVVLLLIAASACLWGVVRVFSLPIAAVGG